MVIDKIPTLRERICNWTYYEADKNNHLLENIRRTRGEAQFKQITDIRESKAWELFGDFLMFGKHNSFFSKVVASLTCQSRKYTPTDIANLLVSIEIANGIYEARRFTDELSNYTYTANDRIYYFEESLTNFGRKIQLKSIRS